MNIIYTILLAYWLACGIYTMRHGRDMGLVERVVTAWVILPIMLAWVLAIECAAWVSRVVEGWRLV